MNEFEEQPEIRPVTRIKVFGIGGGGCNAVQRMVNDNVKGVEFYVCNTDLQTLQDSNCPNKIILGKNVSKGQGAGANPEIGLKAAQESEADIRKAMTGADMYNGGFTSSFIECSYANAMDYREVFEYSLDDTFRFESEVSKIPLIF